MNDKANTPPPTPPARATEGTAAREASSQPGTEVRREHDSTLKWIVPAQPDTPPPTSPTIEFKPDRAPPTLPPPARSAAPGSFSPSGQGAAPRRRLPEPEDLRTPPPELAQRALTPPPLPAAVASAKTLRPPPTPAAARAQTDAPPTGTKAPQAVGVPHAEAPKGPPSSSSRAAGSATTVPPPPPKRTVTPPPIPVEQAKNRALSLAELAKVPPTPPPEVAEGPATPPPNLAQDRPPPHLTWSRGRPPRRRSWPRGVPRHHRI